MYSFIPGEIREQVFARDGDVCQYCGTTTAQGYIIEHVVPDRRGGPSEPYNLVIACISCNQRKAGNIWIPRNIHKITEHHPEWRERIFNSAEPINKGRLHTLAVKVPYEMYEDLRFIIQMSRDEDGYVSSMTDVVNAALAAYIAPWRDRHPDYMSEAQTSQERALAEAAEYAIIGG